MHTVLVNLATIIPSGNILYYICTIQVPDLVTVHREVNAHLVALPYKT